MRVWRYGKECGKMVGGQWGSVVVKCIGLKCRKVNSVGKSRGYGASKGLTNWHGTCYMYR